VSGSFDVALLFFGLADLIARLRLCRYTNASADKHRVPGWVAVYGGALGAAALVTSGPGAAPLVIAAAALATALACRPALRFLHLTGFLSVATTAQFRITGVVWLVHFAATAQVGALSRVSLVAMATAGALVLPVLLIDGFLVQEAACRTGLTTANIPDTTNTQQPRVSVHVPCYAEPPEVVIATLDALARLDYDNFEVITVDNNTTDETLWRPVEQHCRRLGIRFRFFHVDPLCGAKAGALNFALARTDAKADLVAVVDADYHAEENFLRDLVGAFTDERLAFVQTSHDYRDWAGSSYLTGCYWEYRASYCGYMRSRSMRESALITGTMCLIRKRALAEVGGWAEWCCTEDSELSVRLHAAGYTGRYLHRTYGRGLVPEEYAGYRQQRHRWVYGPTQEFRRHWRLFLPARWAAPSALTPGQKFLFAHHGAREMAVAATSLIATLTVVALTLQHIAGSGGVPIPAAALVGLAAAAASWTLLLWPLFRHVVGCSPAQACSAIVSRLALFGARLCAGTDGWRSSSGTFRRTNKFRPSSSRAKAIADTARETSRGLGALALSAWALAAGGGSGLTLPLAGYLTIRAVGWLAAPALALSADRSIRNHGDA
jgi:hypothetical protein